MAAALLDEDILSVPCRVADEEETVLLDFFSMDLNEVVVVVVDFF